MVYRNIYINGNGIRGRGSVDVEYTGHIFTNAESIKNFNTRYDSSKDLFISCGSCAAKKYGRFIKKDK